MANRTPNDAKATRCEATEGDQQCLQAQHAKNRNHTWGKPGETAQWHADGTLKAPAADPTEQLPAAVHADLDQADQDLAAGKTHALEDVVAELDEQPTPGTSHADAFNGEAERRAAEHRAQVAASVTADDIAEMEQIGATHHDIARPDEIRPTANHLPGHSIGDIAADDVMDSVLFDDSDAQLQFERVWLRTVARTVLRIGADRHRYGKLADAEQVMALRDQVEQLVANRGLGTAAP